MTRNLRHVSSQLLCLQCFDLIAPRVEDSIRLQRIVPYIIDYLRKNSRENAVITSVAIAVCFFSICFFVTSRFFSDLCVLFPDLCFFSCSSVSDSSLLVFLSFFFFETERKDKSKDQKRRKKQWSEKRKRKNSVFNKILDFNTNFVFN